MAGHKAGRFGAAVLAPPFWRDGRFGAAVLARDVLARCNKNISHYLLKGYLPY